MKTYFMSILLLIISSCTEKDFKGSFLQEEVSMNKSFSVTDSVWENYRITQYYNSEYDISHEYHFIDTLYPFKYSFSLNGATLLKFDLKEDESVKSGTSIHFISKETIEDTIDVEVLVACPYVLRECLKVDILQKYENETVDTFVINHKPKGDVIHLRVEDKDVRELIVRSVLCEDILDEEIISLYNK